MKQATGVGQGTVRPRTSLWKAALVLLSLIVGAELLLIEKRPVGEAAYVASLGLVLGLSHLSAHRLRTRRRRFDRFEPAARQALMRAEGEARLLGHRAIGTEHLLLTLVRLDHEHALLDGIWQRFGVSVESIATQPSLKSAASRMTETPAFSAHAKQAIACAANRAVDSGDGTVRLSHLALGLLDTDDGLAARLLAEQQTDLRGLQTAISQMAEVQPGLSAP